MVSPGPQGMPTSEHTLVVTATASPESTLSRTAGGARARALRGCQPRSTLSAATRRRRRRAGAALALWRTRLGMQLLHCLACSVFWRILHRRAAEGGQEARRHRAEPPAAQPAARRPVLIPRRPSTAGRSGAHHKGQEAHKSHVCLILWAVHRRRGAGQARRAALRALGRGGGRQRAAVWARAPALGPGVGRGGRQGAAAAGCLQRRTDGRQLACGHSQHPQPIVVQPLAQGQQLLTLAANGVQGRGPTLLANGAPDTPQRAVSTHELARRACLAAAGARRCPPHRCTGAASPGRRLCTPTAARPLPVGTAQRSLQWRRREATGHGTAGPAGQQPA